jgi:hypothetical protein
MSVATIEARVLTARYRRRKEVSTDEIGHSQAKTAGGADGLQVQPPGQALEDTVPVRTGVRNVEQPAPVGVAPDPPAV